MKPNSTSPRLVFSILLSAGLCISSMRAQAQIDPGNAPEDQSAAAQKAKAQEQKSKLGSKGGEKRIIKNGKVEKGLGGPDTKTKGAEAFNKAGKGDKALGGPDTKTKGAEAFTGAGKVVGGSEKPATKATVKAFNPQPDPPGKAMKAPQENVVGSPLVGPAIGKAIGNPANDSNEDKAAKKKLSPEDVRKAGSGLPSEGSDKGTTIKPGSKSTDKAVAESGKSKLKKKGLSPEDRKKAADALGDALGDDGGGRGGTITPGTPNREPPNLQKKRAYAPSDGSGETISPGASATPRPKLQKKP